MDDLLPEDGPLGVDAVSFLELCLFWQQLVLGLLVMAQLCLGPRHPVGQAVCSVVQSLLVWKSQN